MRPGSYGLDAPCQFDVTFVFRGSPVLTESIYDPRTRLSKSVTVASGLWTGRVRSGTVRVKLED